MKIRITKCDRTGRKGHANLTPGSVHTLVPAPRGERNWQNGGVWVQGEYGPIKVLFSELETVAPPDYSEQRAMVHTKQKELRRTKLPEMKRTKIKKA